jgi:hypothetical protein
MRQGVKGYPIEFFTANPGGLSEIQHSSPRSDISEATLADGVIE